MYDVMFLTEVEEKGGGVGGRGDEMEGFLGGLVVVCWGGNCSWGQNGTRRKGGCGSKISNYCKLLMQIGIMTLSHVELEL